MMRNVRIILVLTFLLTVAACSGPGKVKTPLETLQEYANASKNKDLTKMKLLLTEATLKLHADQAKAQNVTLDEIIQRETFFSPEQRVFSYRNETIDGDRATVDVKNNFGGWDQIILLKEGGVWKIDKKGTAQQMIEQSESDMKDLDDQIDAGRITDEQLDQLDLNGTPGLKPATPMSNDNPEDKGILDPRNGQPSPSPSDLGRPPIQQ
ncbi:MAG: hypothetical protein HKN33_08680 [Pyrinomonadaceae bacterium]|nr:hypothetical protein [Pyrinomonadaceae bacterium]